MHSIIGKVWQGRYSQVGQGVLLDGQNLLVQSLADLRHLREGNDSCTQPNGDLSQHGFIGPRFSRSQYLIVPKQLFVFLDSIQGFSDKNTSTPTSEQAMQVSGDFHSGIMFSAVHSAQFNCITVSFVMSSSLQCSAVQCLQCSAVQCPVQCTRGLHGPNV